MVWRQSVVMLGLLAVLAGCQGTEMAGEQKTTTAGAGIGPTAGDSFGEVVGTGLVGGAAGDLGGQGLDVGEFRNPRFGR
jgi:hypothetical protein